MALLRGQHAHNTNVTYVSAPGGGYEKFVLSGQDKDYLPQWLKAAGYSTSYLGKLMNQYGYYNYDIAPKGWDHFDGLLDPYTYIYNTPIFSLNGARPRYYQRSHQTDVLRAKAVSHLHTLINSGQPWYFTVAAVAPHQQFNETGQWPPVPATRHQHLFPGLKAPRTKNFNPAVQRKPSWVGQLPVMDQSAIDFADDTYRRRAQALQGVNEMFHELLDILEAAGELENTYIVFSSDHGYHIGQHRVVAGKMLPYKEDTNVPFIIRGPGVPRGQKTQLPSNHVDIAPTLLGFAGVAEEKQPVFLDGRDLSDYWKPAGIAPEKVETVNIEFWGFGLIETATGGGQSGNTYKTVRVVSKEYGYLYSHWCTNETELYDTVADPYELTPIPVEAAPRLHSRLNALLLTTKSCERDSCRNPWSTLHPDGGVSTLADALDPKFDAFYESLPRVAFRECLNYLLKENEAPFYPKNVEFGEKYRDKEATDGLFTGSTGPVRVPGVGNFGDKYEPLEVIEERARCLTDDELVGTAGSVDLRSL